MNVSKFFCQVPIFLVAVIQWAKVSTVKVSVKYPYEVTLAHSMTALLFATFWWNAMNQHRLKMPLTAVLGDREE